MTMAAIKFNKGSEEWLMFMDYWNLCQNNWGIENNNEYWLNLINATDDFIQKYKGSIFAKKIAIAFLDAQEERRKQLGIGVWIWN